MKILYTTPVLEHPPAGGPNLRTENSIKALARISELHLVPRLRRALIGGPDAETFYRRRAHAFRYAPSVEGLSENFALRNVQKLLRRLDPDADARFLVAYCDTQGIDILWVNFGNVSFPLIEKIKRIRPDLRIVCDTDSVWSRFILRELAVESDPARRREITRAGEAKEREERAWTDLCEATLAVSEVDAAYYRSFARDPERVHLFANVVDLDSYAPPPQSLVRHPALYLAGTFGHPASPMDRAARFILDEVLPRVRARVPDVHFYIVGKGADQTLGHAAGPSVTVTGKVPSVLPYLWHADVVLVPLAFESGTRFKILEAGACGRPVVSTTLGAEGLPVTHGKDILIADDAEFFAGAILTVLENRELALALGHALGGLVREGYGLETLQRQGAAILAALGAAAVPAGTPRATSAPGTVRGIF